MLNLNKGGDTVVTLKDIDAIFRHLKKILHMLDKIYHALELDKEEDNGTS